MLYQVFGSNELLISKQRSGRNKCKKYLTENCQSSFVKLLLKNSGITNLHLFVSLTSNLMLCQSLTTFKVYKNCKTMVAQTMRTMINKILESTNQLPAQTRENSDVALNIKAMASKIEKVMNKVRIGRCNLGCRDRTIFS